MKFNSFCISINTLKGFLDMYLFIQFDYEPPKIGHKYLALVAHAVTQAIGGMELEDGLRTVRRPKRLHGHCGVCISPTVMLNPLWGMAWLMLDLISIAAVRASVVLNYSWCGVRLDHRRRKSK